MGLRLVSTATLLGLLVWQFDARELAGQLGTLSPAWVLLGLLLSVPQVVISAFRWRLTATQLGIALPWGRAIREYYLATFLNQVLPGGVMGDATRAWRHANAPTNVARVATQDRRTDETPSQRAEAPLSSAPPPTRGGAAVRAVVIERASGQLALLLVTVAALLVSPLLRNAIADVSLPTVTLYVLLVGLGGAVALGLLGSALERAGRFRTALGRRLRHALRLFATDLRRALLEARVWPRQLASSLLVVATYVAVFLCAAQALGLPRSPLELLPLIPPLLMAMAIPLTVAGWGVREGAAALLWPVAGLPAQEGITLSITYGLLILAGSLPGLFVLAWGYRRPASNVVSSSRASSDAQPIKPLRSGDAL
ncbi:lysylphosphatidylglycerol synthase transmembrane domain-containing protein [Salinicola aestuarinus]|uniref:lysylphosphatidylglycerol synthase transmembrane domain-containing protein n=1 Tax=Salinicola aestuarinus TaxID=1949082 RepID=UPI001CB72195|nr:lysylphosphatidylglycerol synthase transmembrane domain-containing protein [Salinicola aestuarinus]